MNKTLLKFFDYSYEAITGKSLQLKRIEFVKQYQFRQEIIDRFQIDYNVKNDDIFEIVETFKSYLLIFTGRDQIFCSMPSSVVDDLWHTFLLFTKEYHYFCDNAFGFFLHHNPNSIESDSNLKNGAHNTYVALYGLDQKFQCLDELKKYTNKDEFFAHIFNIDEKLSVQSFPLLKY